MKRFLGFLSYYVGLALMLWSILESSRDSFGALLLAPFFVIPIWWIAAGIAIRLGVFPSEFFSTIARAAGFLELKDESDPLSD
ncbi:MAG: hypothetical protein LC808_31150 [Actinobacteria bacterium]|nr:hypothetical protein [Actinomycetota bacterium]